MGEGDYIRIRGISFLSAVWFVAILLFTNSLCAGATYYFNKSGSSAWTTAANWSPTRTTPAASDILIFDGNSTNHITTTVTGIPTQTFGLLSVLNSCTVTFTTSLATGIILTIANPGLSFSVGSGSQLILAGNNSITTFLSLGVGTVNGDVVFNQAGAGTDHVLSSATTNGIIFTSGATFQLNPTHNEPADDPFGSGTANSVVFLSGAMYYHGGSTTGTANFTVGDPFSLTPNASVSVFSSGSLFYCYDQSNLTFSGRTVGNMICNFSTANTVIGDKYTGTGQDSTWVILGNLTLLTNGGSTGTANYTSASPVHVYGNFTIQNMPFFDTPPLKSDNIFEIDGSLIASTTFTSATSGSRIYLFGGSSTQNISLYGNNSVLSAVSVNNSYSGATDIVLGTSVSVVSTLSMATGNIVSTFGNTLSLGTSTTTLGAGILNRKTGNIIGPLVRWFSLSGATTGLAFPVGTATTFNEVTVRFNGAPSLLGSVTTFFTVSNANSNGLPLTDGALTLNTVNPSGFWTVSTSSLLSVGTATYNITLEANGFSFIASTTNARIVWRANGGQPWALVGSPTTYGGIVFGRTGINTTFGDFAIAESNLPPYAGFTATPISGNGPLLVNFGDTSLNLPTSWSWNFGDGATTTIQNPSHTYAAVGAPATYTIQLIATNSFGSGTATQIVTISEPGPSAGFSGSPTSGNGAFNVIFTDTSGNVYGTETQIFDFGDGSARSTTVNSGTVNHTYSVVGATTQYTVKLIVITPFGTSTATNTNYVTVTEPAPNAGFSGTPTSGNGSLAVVFTDTSGNVYGTETQIFIFGDGSARSTTVNSPTVSHTYGTVTVPTNYTVQLIVFTPFGTSTATQSNYITVNESAPSAGFSGSPTSGAMPLTVAFTDTTNYPTSSSYTTWNWNFGDGASTTIENPSHTYTTVGSYTLTLIVTTPFGTNTAVYSNYINVLPHLYTWSVASGSWAVATNWTPTRTTPATDDILVFDGSISGLSLVTATNVPTQTIGELEVINASTTTLDAGGVQILTVGTTGLSLFVDSSCQLIFGGKNAITLNLPIYSVGTINGDIICAQTTKNTPMVLSSATVNGIIFTSGATFQLAPWTNETATSANPFGSGTANSVVFQSGATYYHGGTPAGPPNKNVGDPFSILPPASLVVFQPGSLFYMYDQTSVSFSGRTTGNLTMNFNSVPTPIGDNYAGTGQDSTWVILGNLTLVTTGGTNGTANYTSASPVHIYGNLNIQSMSFLDQPPSNSNNVFEIDGSLNASTTFTSAASGSRIYLFGGSSTQTISLYGNNSVLSAVSVNNVYSGATDIVLGTNVSVVSTLNMAVGNIITGANTLSLGTSTTSFGILNRTSGTIIGNFARYIPAGSSGVDFPVGTINNFNDASVVFTGGGSTTAGVLTTMFTPSNPGTNGLPLTDGTLVLDTVNPAGYWTIHGTATTGSSNNSGVVLTANGFTFAGVTANARIVYRTNSSSAWTLIGNAGSNIGDQIVRNGITNATHWGDYGVAESNLPPYAGFTVNTNSGSGPLTVNFTDTSLNLPTSWNWTFGDGSTSALQNPSHTYASVGAPTTYIVTLIATNTFGSGTATQTITVTGPGPSAGFSGSPTSGNGPLTVNFTDTSANLAGVSTTWNWNFGDGSSTTIENPSHTYISVGAPTTYTVTLIVTTPFGTSTSTRLNYISVTEPAPSAGFNANPTSGNGPLTVIFTDTSANNPTSWSWNFGDGASTTIQNPSHLYASVGAPTTYTVRLIATNVYGASTATSTIFVTELPPSAGFNGNPTSGAVPLTVVFTDGTNYPTASTFTTWTWNFGDGSSTTIENPSHTYGTVGTYTVTLIVTTPFGTSTSTQANYITVVSNNYTWSVASGSWQTATNWTPTRTTPATNDVLVFDGSLPGLSLVTATNIPTQTIGELEIINGSTATFTSTAARTITAGTTGLALYVGTSSQLILGGANAIAVSLPSVSVGTVNGDIVFAQTANVATLLSSATANGIIFTNGASFQNAPTASVNSKDPFTSTASTANSVVFQSGATYYSNGTKTGIANGVCGDPFSLPSPASVAVFQPGSMLYAWDIKNISFSGRTVGNVTFNQQTTARSFGSETTLPLYIANTCRFAGTGIKLLTYNGTGAVFIGEDLIIETGSAGFADGPTLISPTNFEVQGNINAQGTFTPSSDPNRTYLVDGVNPQTVTLNSGASLVPNLTVNNSSGIILGSPVSVNSTLTMTNGNINTNGNPLVLGTSITQTGILNWNSGTIIGSFTRWISKNTGSWNFPIGTQTTFNELTVNFTTRPSAGGSLTTSFTPINPGTNGLPLVDGSLSLLTVSPSGYWTMSFGNGLTGGIYSLTLEANGFNFASATSDVRILQRNNGASAWTLDGSAGANSGVAIVRTGMSGTGDYGIGEPLLSAGFIANPSSGYGPLVVNFTDTSAYNPTSWSWNFGDGATDNTNNPTPSHTYGTVAAPTTYIVTLVVSNAYGTSSATGMIYVTELPPLAGFSVNTNNGYAPYTVFFTDTSGNNPGNWNWNFGDGGTSVMENPQHTYAAVGAPTTYTVTLIETNIYGSSTASQVISVTEPPPIAGFSYNPSSGNGPLTVVFTDTSANLAGISTTWSWTFGDGSTSTLENPTHVYSSVSAPTTYVVKLIVTTPFGSDSFKKNNGVFVTEPSPSVGFTASQTTGFGPYTVNFTDTTLNNPTTWNWSFGDGSTSTLENPSHTYAMVTTPTSYTVRLIATNVYGSGTSTKTIFVTEPSPVVGFYGSPTVGSIPLPVNFTDTSGNSPYKWSWSFGDGGTATTQNPLYTYNSATSPIKYNVQLVATNTYGSTTGILNTYISITGPVPIAGFFVPSNLTSGIGGIYVANFRDTSANNPIFWNWNFGDGGTSILKNPSHSYGVVSQPTTYTVTEIVSDGFGTSTAISPHLIYVVDPAPSPGFYASPTSGNGPLMVNFTDTSGSNPTAWSWNFGDGSTSNSQNPSHTYAAVTTPTYYTVQLISSNSFGTTTAVYTNYIYVSETSPIAGFYGSPTSGRGPLMVLFTDTSANNPTSWNWGFGDGGNSNLQNPSHTYASVGSSTSYTVRLIASNTFGTNTVSYTNYIHVTEPAPSAGFYGTPTVGYGPMLVNFTDTSGNNPTAWSWNFGDGGNSNLQNPSHTYNKVFAPTSYSVQLIVSNTFGASTYIQSNYITVEVSSTIPPYFPYIPSLKLFLTESLAPAFDMYDYNEGGPILSYSLITNFLGLTSLDSTSYGLQSTIVSQGSFDVATSGTNYYQASNNSGTITLTNKVKYSRYKIQKLPKVGLNVGESYTVNVENYALADGVPLPPPSFGSADALQVSDTTLVSAVWSGNTAVVITSLAPIINGPVNVYVTAATQPDAPYGEDIDKEVIQVYTSLQLNGTFITSNDTTAYGLQVPPGRILLATHSWLTSYTDADGTQANGIWAFHFTDADDGVELTPFAFDYIPMLSNQWYTMRMRIVSDNSTNTHQAFLFGFSQQAAAGITTDIAANIYFGIPAVWTWIETPLQVHAASTTYGFPQIQFKAGQSGNVYLDEIQVINSAPTLVDANRYKTRYDYAYGNFDQESDTVGWGQEIYAGANSAPGILISGGALQLDFSGATAGTVEGIKWTANNGVAGVPATFTVDTPRQLGVRASITTLSGDFNSLGIILVAAYGVQSSGQVAIGLPESNLIAAAGIGTLVNGTYRTVGMPINPYYQMQFGVRSDVPGVLLVGPVDLDLDQDDPYYGDPSLFP